ncbi:melatonin receptor type 1B-like [Gigantopelta aegis]|uniref:melatonin receptor type 1B-like n=1 Tax=Gigantopelta aegis TaxID=1735272 RepID=UPI001B88888E|nr:melatonin receptor type 1B-like [Gigantopelta aegis]
MSSNASEELDHVDPAVLVSLSSVLIVVAALTTVGNIMIIFLVFKTPSLQKPAFVLTANITLADLLFSIFGLPQYIAALLTQSRVPPFGTASCYIQVYASNAPLAATVYFMAGTAVFRMINVCYPVKCIHICARKWMIAFCLMFWTVPFAVCAAFDKGVEYDRFKYVCVFSSPGYLYGFVVIVVMPAFIVMPIAYGKVLYFIRQSRRRIEAHGTASVGAVNIQKDRHVFKLVLTIMLIFIVSIIIPNVFYSLSRACESCSKSTTELLGAWLVRLRPTVNFIAIMITCSFLRDIFCTQVSFCCKR